MHAKTMNVHDIIPLVTCKSQGGLSHDFCCQDIKGEHKGHLV